MLRRLLKTELRFFATSICCFFFQAEDGIRDRDVTGVQTCALPISKSMLRNSAVLAGLGWATPTSCTKVVEIGRASCREREEMSGVDGSLDKKQSWILGSCIRRQAMRRIAKG